MLFYKKFLKCHFRMLFEHVLTWLSKHYCVSCHGSSFTSVIEFNSEELYPACVMKEKNNKLFCWCSWDEVTGCKKLDSSCSHLCFCDQACSSPLISVTDEIHCLGSSSNTSWCLTTILSVSHDVLLQKTASH